MAQMIPSIDPNVIENKGEGLFYEAASRLPQGYTVIHGYKYIQHACHDTVREADFIIIHPTHGFLVVEVKQGEAAYHAGQWHEVKQGGYVPLFKDPVEQARTAMYHILHQYKNENRGVEFSLKSRFVVCFPECTRFGGSFPADLLVDSLWLEKDLLELESKVENLLTVNDYRGQSAPSQQLVRILSPSLRIMSSLTDRIEHFSKAAEHILTEEQERILEETMEDKRKLFLGAAGTGKTFIAIEKARREAIAGNKVLLTCYNKHLVDLIAEQVNDERVTVMNFHNYLESFLQAKGCWEPPNPENMNEYYRENLPTQGYSYFDEAPDEDKFDCILIDEGQDFLEDWVVCLEAMLREDGELYMFADPNQNIFGIPDNWTRLKRYTISTHRLTQNFRNTEEINEWTKPFIQGKPAKSRMSGGAPVVMHSWKDAKEQKKMIEKVVGRLVSQGVPPNHIMILSPYKRENSSLAGATKLREWALTDFNSGKAGIKYATIRSYKGLESNILLLIDIKAGSRACTPADVYVGASRGRYLLHVFHHEEWSLNQLRKSDSDRPICRST